MAQAGQASTLVGEARLQHFQQAHTNYSVFSHGPNLDILFRGSTLHRKGKIHAATRPDRPVSADSLGCIAELAIQRELGILSERRSRFAPDCCDPSDFS